MGETNDQVERLEQVFASIDETPRGKTYDAIMGIIEEGKEVMDEYKGMPALDAGLLPPHKPSNITKFRVMAPSKPGQTNWVTPTR